MKLGKKVLLHALERKPGQHSNQPRDLHCAVPGRSLAICLEQPGDLTREAYLQALSQHFVGWHLARDDSFRCGRQCRMHVLVPAGHCSVHLC